MPVSSGQADERAGSRASRDDGAVPDSGGDALGVEDRDRYFRDGEFDYAVRAAPAAFPNLLAVDPVGPSGDLRSLVLSLTAALAVGLVATWRDDRWKVLVARRRRKVRRVVHVIAAEFVSTQEQAEARQAEIRTGWVAGSHRDDAVIKLRLVRKMRKLSREQSA
jgi:hypothetical protein